MNALSATERAIYNEIDAERPLCCTLCLAGIPGGDLNAGGGHHHVIPRSRLPGEANWAKLWAKTNIALACQAHHQRYQSTPGIWQAAMVTLGFANKSDYLEWNLRDPPAFGRERSGERVSERIASS